MLIEDPAETVDPIVFAVPINIVFARLLVVATETVDPEATVVPIVDPAPISNASLKFSVSLLNVTGVPTPIMPL